ncbi:MAG: hypothetical protein ACOVMN_08725 [Flexibacteraceae bacterium]
MKNLIFCFLFVFSWSLASAQELTVASITEVKSNAEWLKTSAGLANKPFVLTNSDLRVINQVVNRLRVGKGLSISGLVLTPVYLSGGLLTTFQGAFTRMPAHRKLSKFIDSKYADTLFKNSSYTDLNLEHLLTAEKHLDRAQTVSYIAMGLSVLNVVITSELVRTADGWDGIGYLFMGVVTFNITNSIATGINLVYTSKAINELRKIH